MRGTNLDASDSAWGNDTGAVVWLCAVSDDFSFNVANETVRVRRTPETKIILIT
jgi:hypothetical protein